MSRSVLCGLMSWLLLGSPAAGRADDAEDKAVKFVEGLKGRRPATRNCPANLSSE